MKKILSVVFAALAALSVTALSACGDVPDGEVKLVAVTAAEVGVKEGVDYFVIAEPAASTKVNALPNLEFSGDLQELYGGENGYPQAVVVAKKEVVGYVASTLSSKLKGGASWLLSDEVSAETIVAAVNSHLTDGMSPSLNAQNLTKAVIENCSVNFVDAWECKEEVKDFMQKFNSVSETGFGTPSDGFFLEESEYGAVQYDGTISVYSPDGAPALGLAKLMATDELLNCTQTEYNVVDASTIQTFVTGANPAADVCVLPVNLAVKLLGSGEKYTMLGTLTHGNLYLVSNGEKAITPRNMRDLKGKTVGVVNLAAVPGLTFKVVLDKYGLEFTELQ